MAEQKVGGWSVPYKFSGKVADADRGVSKLDPETGLYHFGVRFYDPRISLWYGVDPLVEKFYSWSPYNYVYNNPLKFVDQDGMEPGDPSKVQRQLVKNIESSNRMNKLDVRHQTACYPTTWKRVSQAYSDVSNFVPKELNNTGIYKKDRMNSTTGRWYPSGNSDFLTIASSNFKSKKWDNLPNKFRGEGLPGAMAFSGLADTPEDVWEGNLKPGAVLQMWNSPSDYMGIKSGKGYDNSDINSIVSGLFSETTETGHSAIFMGYEKVLGIITGIKYADQKGMQTMFRLNPYYRVVRGSDLKDID